MVCRQFPQDRSGGSNCGEESGSILKALRVDLLFPFSCFVFFVCSFFFLSVAILAQVGLLRRLGPDAVAAMSGSARNVVSLDSSSSGSSDDVIVTQMPFVSIAQLYKEQRRMKRELDYMFEQVDDMQVKIDGMFAEIAAFKKRRL